MKVNKNDIREYLKDMVSENLDAIVDTVADMIMIDRITYKDERQLDAIYGAHLAIACQLRGIAHSLEHSVERPK